MTHDREPHRETVVYCSGDYAIDREAMGAKFAEHFGDTSLDGQPLQFGTRDPSVLVYRAGMTPSAFTLRALTVQQLRACKGPKAFADQCLRALMYSLVSASLRQPLSHESCEWVAVRAKGQDFLDLEQIDSLCERVGEEACVEIGSVALQRTTLRPFSVPHFMLPADSVLALMRLNHIRAATPGPEKSGTPSTDAP